jgi:LAS superfamily LD-carboxypeptidase LdcB
VNPIRRLAALFITAIAVFGAVLPATAASRGNDPRAQRDRVRQQRGQVAADLDVLRAKDAEVRRALSALDANLAAQENRLADARRAVAAAEQRAATARVAEQRMLARIAELQADLRDKAVEAYIGGRGSDTLSAVLRSQDLDEASRRNAVAGMVFDSGRDLQDKLAAAREDLTAARQDAEAAAGEAQTRRAEADQRLQELGATRAQQATFASQLDTRIESRLAEAANLAQLDSQLSASIVRQQEELARQARLAQLPKARPTTRTAPAASVRPVSGVPLRNVRGIWVSTSIADNLEAMLAAAQGDGIVLSGSGYRDPARQQQLRNQNCPDPYNSPPNDCSPPTARAGSSMHERGLAIDFTYGGRVISSHSSPAWQWLAGNAGRYGFKNLPEEPWHWSSTGQ